MQVCGRYNVVMSIVAILYLGVTISLFSTIAYAQAPTDIEKNFTQFNSTDLSGDYSVSGVNEEGTAYEATLKLTKWNTFVTGRGNVLQTFKMNYVFPVRKFNGIAVFDGYRLYFASSEGNKDDFSLSLLSKLVLSPTERRQLANFWDLWRNSYKEGKYAKWEGKSPWYGYCREEDDIFGYKFPMTGKFTEFSSYGHGFPPVPDTGQYRVLVLKDKDGHDDKKYERDGTWYNEADGLAIFTRGENLVLSFIRYDSHKNGYVEDYWGCGMLVEGKDPSDTILVAMTGGSSATQYGWMNMAGPKFSGVVSWVGGGTRFTEEWTPSQDVAAKNPHIFK